GEGAASAATALAAAAAAEKAQQQAASAASAAAASAAAASAIGGQGAPPSETFDLATAGLGVDWASWGMGAEIDHGHTSPGLGRSLLGCASRAVTSLLPSQRTLFGFVSHPPEAVLAWDSAPPSRCYSIEGNGAVAIRFLKPVRAGHVVLEQLPSWATAKPLAAPRSFEVLAWPADGVEESYSVKLGSFEYQLDGLRAQVFPLINDSGSVFSGNVKGIKFSFGQNWGEEGLTMVCRLRVLAPP
ncbi:unnamed protein product, partial [Polarella glacialis]